MKEKMRHMIQLLAILAVLLTGALSAQAAAAYDRINVMVVCGAVDALQNTAGQAEKVYTLFSSSNHIAQNNNKIVLTYASRYSNIENFNQGLSYTFSNSTENTINVFYYVGHGAVDINGVSKLDYWVSGKCKDSAGNGIIIGSGETASQQYYYYDLIEELNKYKGKFIIIMDCCGSGSLITYGLRANKNSAAQSDAKRRKFIALLTSTPGDYVEKPYFTSPSKAPYTKELLKQLYGSSKKKGKKADENKDGFITVQELHNYLAGIKGLKKKTHGCRISANKEGKNFPLFQLAVTKLNRRSATLKAGKTLTLKASLKPSDSGQKLVWKSMDSRILSVRQSGDRKAIVTGLEAGCAYVTVSIVDKNHKICNGTSYSCKITVKQPFTLSPTSKTLYVGQTFTIKAGGGASSGKITWKTNNGRVATVNSSGKVTAKKAGTATITAALNGSSQTCKVKVINPSIKVDPAEKTIYSGDSFSVRAAVKGPSSKVTWSVDHKDVASVSSDGKVTGKSAGTATITATANGKSARCTVTVNPPAGFLSAGARVAYDPGDGLRYWYVLKTDGDQVYLLLDSRLTYYKNITDSNGITRSVREFGSSWNRTWNNIHDTYVQDTTFGPVELMTAYVSATEKWTNVAPLNFTYESQERTSYKSIAITNGTAVIYGNDALDTVTTINGIVRARPITMEEVEEVTGLSHWRLRKNMVFKKQYEWLYKYNCWTLSTKNAGNRCAWSISSDGKTDHSYANGSDGLRPVIVVPASSIQY